MHAGPRERPPGGPTSAVATAPRALGCGILWTVGFRPFFLAASLWSAVAIAMWIVMLFTGYALPSRFDPLRWHIHEMLFGFVPAAIAGFLLTAIPTWTGRKPIRGALLAGLAALWLAGRIACALSASLPFWFAAGVDLAFLFALAAVMLREVALARSWRNLPMPMPVALLGVADLLMYLEAAGRAVPAGLGWRLGLAALMILVSVVGGRIIPAFTRNWLARRVSRREPGREPWTGSGPTSTAGLVLRVGPALGSPAGRALDRLTLGVLHAGLVGWAFLPGAHVFAVLLILASALLLWRLARWGGVATFAEPLLAVLHVGYGWLMVGAALLGVSVLTPAIPLAAAVHALTAGTIGTLILAVMTRVSLGHTGRPLEAGGATVAIYLLVNVAAAMRVIAELAIGVFVPLVLLSALLWVAAFLLFVVRYGPMLAAPRVS
ncbi:MAG: NnrS family protein [Steroidobacteraceae bacterium]